MYKMDYLRFYPVHLVHPVRSRVGEVLSNLSPEPALLQQCHTHRMAAKPLYDDLVMDHIRNARNYRVPDAANRQSHGSNPLCGDDVTVYLKLDGDRIEDAAFQCSCCGISMASASMLTETIAGWTAAEARRHARFMIDLLGGRAVPDGQQDARVAALLETVREFPARAGCAALPWTTLEAALDGRPEAGLAG